MIKQEQQQQASLNARSQKIQKIRGTNNLLEQPHQGLSAGLCKTKILTSKFSYLLLCNPAHKTEIGTANRWRRLIQEHNFLQRCLAPFFFLFFLVLPFLSFFRFAISSSSLSSCISRFRSLESPPRAPHLSLSFFSFAFQRFFLFILLFVFLLLSLSLFLSLLFQLPSPPYRVHLSLVEQEIAFLVPSSRQQVASGFLNDDVAS